MVKYYQLNYGYRVKIVGGTFAGKTGTVVMGSRSGDVGISLYKEPRLGDYQTREQPSNLEILSRKDPHKLNVGEEENLDNPFVSERLLTMILYPTEVVENAQYFPEYMVNDAQEKLRTGKK